MKGRTRATSLTYLRLLLLVVLIHSVCATPIDTSAKNGCSDQAKCLKIVISHCVYKAQRVVCIINYRAPYFPDCAKSWSATFPDICVVHPDKKAVKTVPVFPWHRQYARRVCSTIDASVSKPEAIFALRDYEDCSGKLDWVINSTNGQHRGDAKCSKSNQELCDEETFTDENYYNVNEANMAEKFKWKRGKTGMLYDPTEKNPERPKLPTQCEWVIAMNRCDPSPTHAPTAMPTTPTKYPTKAPTYMIVKHKYLGPVPAVMSHFNYKENSDETWTYQSPPGTRATVRITYLLTEFDQDFLYVHAGKNEGTLSRKALTGHVEIDTAPDVALYSFTAPANEISIRFTSGIHKTGIQEEGRGFEVHWSFVTVPREIILGPGSAKLVHMNYNNHENITWVYTSPLGTQANLEFISFETEDDYDFVSVHDGRSGVALTTKPLSGSSLTPKEKNINSHSNVIKVRFTSDDLFVRRGFRAVFRYRMAFGTLSPTKGQEQTTPPTMAPSSSLQTVAPTYIVAGHIVELGPNPTTLSWLEEYDNDQDINFQFTSAPDTLAVVEFKLLDIEADYDSLYVIDGVTGEQLQKLSGVLKEPNLTITGSANVLHLRFVSDDSGISKGFSVNLFATETVVFG